MGTSADDVAFSYVGPGSRPPELKEEWSVPGEASYGEAVVFTDEGIPSGQWRPIAVTDAGETLLAIGTRREADEQAPAGFVDVARIAALDARTMELIALSERLPESHRSGGAFTFDPARNRVYLTAGSSSTIVMGSWDPQRQVIEPTVIPGSESTPVSRLYLAQGRVYAASGARLTAYQQLVNGTWRRHEWDLSPLQYEQRLTNYPSGYENIFGVWAGVAVAADGTVFISRAKNVMISEWGVITTRVLLDDFEIVDLRTLETTPVPGSAWDDKPYTSALTQTWDSLTQTPDGGIAAISTNAVRQSIELGRDDEGNWTVSHRSRHEAYGTFGAGAGTVSAANRDRVLSSNPFLVAADGGTRASFPSSHGTGIIDGTTVYYGYRSGSGAGFEMGLARYQLEGEAPRFREQLADPQVALDAGQQQASVTLRSGGQGDGIRVRWQTRPAGSRSILDWTDLEDATEADLTLRVTAADNGRQYRAIAANEYGELASSAATLRVYTAPVFLSQPSSQRAAEGADVTIGAVASGSPEPEYRWQRLDRGVWTDIVASSDNFEPRGGSLVIKDVNLDQDGSSYRVKAVNEVAGVSSRVVRLAVEPRVSIPEAGLRLDGVALDWSGSPELHVAPPAGGANYLSAGISIGDQSSYRSRAGKAEVLHVSPSGVETTPSWQTRAGHIGSGATQVVRLSQGRAELAADGSAEVSWDDASFSVNFYGGIVPFSVTDPVLTVGADGTGVLRGDLSGYASSIAAPDDRVELEPIADVTIATFSDVRLDPVGKVSVTPDYAGVEVSTGEAIPQNRTVAGWGSWPQQFVSFQVATGLSSYWYSSGTAADARKAPSPFLVDFTGAVEGSGGSKPASTVLSTTRVELATPRVAYGRRAVARVRVTAPGAQPSGTVRATVGGHEIAGTLSGGVARLRLPAGIRPGAHRVQVAYDGDGAVGRSSGTTALRVVKASPRVRLALVGKPTASGKRARVRVRVVVPGAGGLRPVGQVVVRDGNRVVATKRLRAGHRGRIVVRLPRLSSGRHHLRAGVLGTGLIRQTHSRYHTVRVR